MFKESKKRERPTEESKKPAWVDNQVLKVNIEDTSRLRKLKTTEGEKIIDGNDYADRLKT